MAQLAEVLTAQLKISEDEILRQGGAVALLGPTGVGKTTTIAKLAARFAMKYGAEQVALITTDNYRIGAHEQLQTYGRIMGCPVRQVRDAEELANALYQFRHRRLVLIDTAGVGQRDIRLTEQLDTLVKNAKVRIRSYLVMSATSQRRVMQEAVEGDDMRPFHSRQPVFLTAENVGTWLNPTADVADVIRAPPPGYLAFDPPSPAAANPA